MNTRVYIEYLDMSNNFKLKRKYFDNEEEAKQFMLDTFDNFNIDCIKYEQP